MVIGYPSFEESKAIAKKYIESGMQILELQIPFSHPTADGTILTDANRKAVKGGTTLPMSIDFLKELKQEYPEQEIMAMTYINKLFTYGLKKFCDNLQEAQIKYLIIPDMPFDSPLAEEINSHEFVQIVPVLSANTSKKRMDIALSQRPDHIYLMADYKITGAGFSINPKIQQVVEHIKAHSPHTKIGLGFGISEKSQVEQVLKVVDYAIIGSAFTKAIDAGTIDEKLASFA